MPDHHIVSCAVDPALRARIDALAMRLRCNRSECLRRLIEEGMAVIEGGSATTSKPRKATTWDSGLW